jgi:RNA polymerase sigma-70 factor (ECF subfamily)
METFYLYHSLLGEIYSRLNNPVEAKKRIETAIKLTQSETERKLLKDKIVVLLK